MAVPTHRPDCETMIWRTTCPDCLDKVYFFSCSCGSKVYFDLNRPPWDPHADRCIPYLVRTLRDVSGYSAAQILAAVDQRARQLGQPIPPDIERQLIDLSQRARPGLFIHRVLPEDDQITIAGRVIEINRQVNFFKRFGLAENHISRALLGQLAKEPHVELTVRSEAEPGTIDCHQATFFYPKKLFARTYFGQHSMVWVVLTPHPVTGQDPVWLAETVDVM